MSFFNLGLPQRIALAVVSAAVTLPAIKLDTALGPDTYVFVLSWWEIIHGVAFGALVMAPFIATSSQRAARFLALMIASVLIYRIAIEAPDIILGGTQLRDFWAFTIAGTTGSVLVAITTKFLAPIQVARNYWLFTAVAGAVGGVVFSYTIEFCDWDTCASVLNVGVYISGWFVWQALVCAAMYLGRRKDNEIKD